MMPPSLVALRYKRDIGDTSTGEVVFSGEGGTQVLEKFVRIDFGSMMRVFSSHLCAHPEADGVFHRIDREGLVPMFLSAEEARNIRLSVEEEIRQRSVEPQKVLVREEKTENIVVPLVAGQDAVAECFGDVVFARTRPDGDVECPICGRWGWCGSDENDYCFYCSHCDNGLELAPGYSPENRWAGISIQALLDTGAEKFFLPRKWNTNGNWITRPQLIEAWDTYKKEKEACLPIR